MPQVAHRHHSLFRHDAATAELIFLQEEGEPQHDESDRPQQDIGIDVSQRGCLGDDGSVDDGIGNLAGLDGVSPGGDDAGCQSRHSFRQISGAGRDVSDQIGLMHLGAAGENRGDHRRSDTATDIAHEVDQAGHAPAFFGRNADEGNQVDWDEEKGKTNDLEYAEPCGAAKANSELKLASRKEHSEGDGEPAEGNQVASLNFAGEDADYGGHEEQEQASAGEHESCGFRGVTQKRLQEERQHDQGGEQDEAEDENLDVGLEEVHVAVHAHIDDGALAVQLPDNQRHESHDSQ